MWGRLRYVVSDFGCKDRQGSLYKYNFAHVLIWYESTIGIHVPYGIS